MLEMSRHYKTNRVAENNDKIGDSIYAKRNKKKIFSKS